tara:strand:- start:508 stop:714 length:207 start_codon:yes stop_codon:yes gene_type:complete
MDSDINFEALKAERQESLGRFRKALLAVILFFIASLSIALISITVDISGFGDRSLSNPGEDKVISSDS